MTYAEKLKDPRLKKQPGIYRLIINDASYIGSAVNLANRLRQHLMDLAAKRHVNRHLQRAYCKYGAIDFEIVEFLTCRDALIEREQFHIDALKPRYNISPRAGSQLGFRHSEASRKRISEIQKGKKLRPETILKMSAASRGRKASPETRIRLSASKTGDKNPFYRAGARHPQYGKPKSSQTRQRISETSRDRGCHKASRNAAAKCGVLYDAETGNNYLFSALKPLCKSLGLSYKSLARTTKNMAAFHHGRYRADYIQLPAGREYFGGPLHKRKEPAA